MKDKKPSRFITDEGDLVIVTPIEKIKAMIEAIKHLPGMHDQQTHDPTKGTGRNAALGTAKTLDQAVELVSGTVENLMREPGHIEGTNVWVDPSVGKLAELFGGKKDNEVTVGIYEPVTRRVMIITDTISHNMITDTVTERAIELEKSVGHIDESLVKEKRDIQKLMEPVATPIFDRSVHFYMTFDKAGTTTNIMFDTKYSGAYNAMDESTDEGKAFKNIDKARDKMLRLNIPSTTPMKIDLESSREPIRSTLE